MSAVDRVNPNSALHWLDAAEAATEHSTVNTPETEVVEIDFMDSLSLLDGDTDPEGIPQADLIDAARDLGWPVFIRSDLTSAKHEGLGAVQARDETNVRPVTADIVSDCAMKSMFPSALLVREWIDIEAEFTAFDGLPIGTEFRVFAGPDDVQCAHYYWPEDSIRNASLPEDEWQEARKRAADEPLPSSVRVAATSAARHANKHEATDPLAVWSVDFALDADGEWWLIDMALAAESWAPDGCRFTEATV